jgi:hypothetical protein
MKQWNFNFVGNWKKFVISAQFETEFFYTNNFILPFVFLKMQRLPVLILLLFQLVLH